MGIEGERDLATLPAPLPQLMLWVKEEPFGLLTPNPTTKLGLTVISKLADYCREKDGCYPHITLQKWGHICKYKLQIPLDISWLYFRLYLLITSQLDVARNLKEKDAADCLLEKIRKTSPTTSTEEMASIDEETTMKVEALPFLIFLYLQNFHRLYRKLQLSNRTLQDRWPKEPSSGASATRSLSEQSGKHAHRRKQIPEQMHHSFLSSYIGDIVEILCKVVGVENAAAARLPLSVVGALSFIVGAATVKSAPEFTEFKRLDDLVKSCALLVGRVDYDEFTLSVDKEKFISWIKSSLRLNPWAANTSTLARHTLPVLLGAWIEGQGEILQISERNKIYWNTQQFPKAWALISSVQNQVLYLPDLPSLTSLKIHRCEGSYIYTASPLLSILVEKCTNCTIYFGPVAKTARFLDCSNLQVIGVGRMFLLHELGGGDNHFNILTPNPPIIVRGKGKVILGPYNSFYPRLERDMDTVGIGPKLQKWNKPLEVGGNGLSIPKDGTGSWSVLREDKFSKFIFPFEMEGETRGIPGKLPAAYEARVNALEHLLGQFKDAVAKKNFSKGLKSRVNLEIMEKFENWMRVEGHLDHLVGLASMGGTAPSHLSTVPPNKRRRCPEEGAEESNEGFGDVHRISDWMGVEEEDGYALGWKPIT